MYGIPPILWTCEASPRSTRIGLTKSVLYGSAGEHVFLLGLRNRKILIKPISDLWTIFHLAFKSMSWKLDHASTNFCELIFVQVYFLCNPSGPLLFATKMQHAYQMIISLICYGERPSSYSLHANDCLTLSRASVLAYSSLCMWFSLRKSGKIISTCVRISLLCCMPLLFHDVRLWAGRTPSGAWNVKNWSQKIWVDQIRRNLWAIISFSLLNCST